MRLSLDVGDVMGRRKRNQAEGLIKISSRNPRAGLGKPVKKAAKSASK